MRWAEGHTYNVKKYFWQVLRSPNLTFQEKLEFVYYAPYYLQSVLFTFATLAWVIGVLILGQKLPMWGEIFGWSLVVSNALALPLMNLTGVLLEGSLKRDADRERPRGPRTRRHGGAAVGPGTRLAAPAQADDRDRARLHPRPWDERALPRAGHPGERGDRQHERVHVPQYVDLRRARHGPELQPHCRLLHDLPGCGFRKLNTLVRSEEHT